MRRLDIEGALGRGLLVVGTNAFVSYEIHAQSLLFSDNLSTDDFDLTWHRNKWAEENPEDNTPSIRLLKLLKSIDNSYAVNHKKPFQAVNDAGFEVELLTALSASKRISDGFNHIPLMEQEWLLKGRPVRHILLGTDLSAAPIVAPDPRWMALHKIWLSQKPIRDKNKSGKDLKQGTRLMQLVIDKMPYDYPIDNSFLSELPPELKIIMEQWQKKNHIKYLDFITPSDVISIYETR